MALKVGELYATLGLDDKKFRKKMNEGESKFKGFGKALGGIAIGAAATAVSAFSAAVVSSLKDFTEFEKKMNEVFTLIPDASEKSMGKMTEDVKEFSKEFGVLPNEVVPALYSSLSAGVPKDNVFEFLETAQMAAKGGVTELETAVDGISSVVNAYGDDVIDAGKASDLMFQAVKGGKTTFDELSGSLFNVIPTASSLGVEFGDVTAAIATMTAQGTPTSVATTQMRQALVELSKEGSATSDTFKNVAGKSFKDFIAEGNNVQDALKLMEKAAKENDVSVSDLFSSVEAGNAVLALTGKGSDKFSSELNAASDSAGATEEAFNKMEEGLGSKLEKIQARFKVWKLDLAEYFEGPAKKAADAILKAMESLPEIFSKVSAFLQPVTDALKESFNVLAENFLPIWDSLKSSFETMMPILQTIATIIGGALVISLTTFNGVLQALGPAIQVIVDLFNMVVSVVMSIISIFTGDWEAAAEYWNEATQAAIDVFTGIWETVKSFFVGFWEFLVSLFPEQTEKIKKFMSDAWNWIKETTSKVWNGIKTFFSDLWEKIKSVVTSAVDSVKNKISNVWNTIKSTTSSMWNGIKSTVTDVWDTLKSKVKSAFNTIKDTISGVWDDVESSTDKIWDGITGSVKGAINGVISAINGMINALNGLSIPLPTIPDWVPGMGGKGGGSISFPNIPNIPSLDVGTNLVKSDGLAMIHKGEQVVPAKHSGPYKEEKNNKNIESLLEKIAKKDSVIVLDTGQLVGATRNRFDQANGEYASLSERWGI